MERIDLCANEVTVIQSETMANFSPTNRDVDGPEVDGGDSGEGHPV